MRYSKSVLHSPYSELNSECKISSQSQSQSGGAITKLLILWNSLCVRMSESWYSNHINQIITKNQHMSKVDCCC